MQLSESIKMKNTGSAPISSLSQKTTAIRNSQGKTTTPAPAPGTATVDKSNARF